MLLLGALVVGVPVAADAQEPVVLEDVTLQGQVLAADGTPLANQSVAVVALDDPVLDIAAFLFTFGASTLACFGEPDDLCPFTGGERFEGTLDAEGRYSFTFPDAHEPGVETNTDYVFTAGSPDGPLASYELELLDAVHDAPALQLWDPSLRIVQEGDLIRAELGDSERGAGRVEAFLGTLRFTLDNGTIDVREVEDAVVRFAPVAEEDVDTGRTIYHQRFVGRSVEVRGTAVPVSRGAPCIVRRQDGTAADGCGHTDGDLVTPPVATDRTCASVPEGFPPVEIVDVVTGETVPCVPPATEVVVDLGSPTAIGQVRPRCDCTIDVSDDAVTWRPFSSTSGSTTARHVRVTGPVASSPEVSVWGPEPVAAPTTVVPAAGPPPPTIVEGTDRGGDAQQWGWAVAALLALVAVGAAAVVVYERRGQPIP